MIGNHTIKTNGNVILHGLNTLGRTRSNTSAVVAATAVSADAAGGGGDSSVKWELTPRW